MLRIQENRIELNLSRVKKSWLSQLFHLLLLLVSALCENKNDSQRFPFHPIKSLIAFDSFSLYTMKHLSLSVAVCGILKQIETKRNKSKEILPLLDHYYSHCSAKCISEANYVFSGSKHFIEKNG